MPTLTVPAYGDREVEFYVLKRGARVHIAVESERPIYAYLVDEDGWAEFHAGESFSTLAGGGPATSHQLRAYIRRDIVWYLILVNNRQNPTAAHWESD